MNSNEPETPEQPGQILIEPSPALQTNDPCAGNHSSERSAIIQQAKDTVGRMLRYAIANPEIEIADDLLSTGVHTLCLPADKFSSQDEVQLWTAYSDLSRLIKPASDISIQIVEGLKDTVVSPDTGGVQPSTFYAKLWHWLGFNSSMSKLVSRCYRDLTEITLYLLFFVGFYIVVQCYSALLSDTLSSSSRLLASLEAQQASERLVNEQTTPAQKNQVKSASMMLGAQFSASSQALVDLTKPLSNMPLLRLSDSTVKVFDNCRGVSWQADTDNNRLLSCIALEREYALSAYTVLSRYILPLLLGFIGATAYVTRLTLFRLSTNSYVPSPRGMLTMRLCLGGLLGAISGIFISSGSTETSGFNISLTLIALLMGYSVEVAFSLFDIGIERLKGWTRTLRTSDGQAVDGPKADASKPHS